MFAGKPLKFAACMNYRILISYIAFILIITISLISGPGCANIVPPSGGDRDSLPPILLKVNPADSTVNFTGNKISLSFDEYVLLDNFEQNVIVSPIPKSLPRATNRLNTISIHIRDTLEPNTTYTINFGDAIKDVNEGNIMKGFTYIFSTGPAIDSLSLRGSILLAETGQVDTNLIVMLHKNGEDSAVFRERPRYITKLDGRGNFAFNNLPPGTFYLYALEDNSRSYRYMDNTKLFAFADSPVVLQQNMVAKTLNAYQAIKQKESSSSSASTGKPNAADRRLKFQTSLKNGNSLDLLEKFSFQFERPLKNFDSTKVGFTADTVFTPLTGYSWSLDSTKKKLTLNYPWVENTVYNLILQKDFAADTLGQQLLRSDTISFKTMKNADYSKLTLRFRNLDFSKNPVLQFIQSGSVVNSIPLASETFSLPMVLPAEYELRILYDTNKNGVWDPGQFYGKHIQPETTKPISRKIIVRPNIDNEYEINL
jgi:Bacterial Ig-like domain